MLTAQKKILAFVASVLVLVCLCAAYHAYHHEKKNYIPESRYLEGAAGCIPPPLAGREEGGRRRLTGQTSLLAEQESNGFFKDIADKDWQLMKQRHKNWPTTITKASAPHMWYQDNFEPTFTCQHERRIGGTGDGPKWVCDPHRIKKNDCLVYSVGSYDNWLFEESVLQEISPTCEIHTFDPTLPDDTPLNKPASVHFHPWGLANESEGKMKTMGDIVKELKHEGRVIDIFKIDCEGCEWTTHEAWFSASVSLRQIQVELHDGTTDGLAPELFCNLQSQGYVIFHKESNTWGSKGDCIEYAFLRLNESFFS